MALPDSSFQDRSVPGGVVHNPASAYAREMAKWEMAYSPYGPPGRERGKVGHQDFPKAMYLMKRSDSNGEFHTVHFMEAADEVAERNLRSRGYGFGQVEAIKIVTDKEQALAIGAGERAYQERNMGERAKAEAAAADDASGQHVAEVPVTPIQKRRTKAEMAAARS